MGRAGLEPATDGFHLAGGASAVLYGRRATIIDVDIKLIRIATRFSERYLASRRSSISPIRRREGAAA
jgi:hypothetical protein